MLALTVLGEALAPADHSALIAGAFSVIIALIGGYFATRSGKGSSGGAGASALTDIIADLREERDDWERTARQLGWQDIDPYQPKPDGGTR